jgi:hypothetical protein
MYAIKVRRGRCFRGLRVHSFLTSPDGEAYNMKLKLHRSEKLSGIAATFRGKRVPGSPSNQARFTGRIVPGACGRKSISEATPRKEADSWVTKNS